MFDHNEMYSVIHIECADQTFEPVLIMLSHMYINYAVSKSYGKKKVFSSKLIWGWEVC